MDDAEFDALMARYFERQKAQERVARQQDAMLREKTFADALSGLCKSGLVPPVGWPDAQYFAVAGGKLYVFTKSGWRRIDILAEAAEANRFVRACDVAGPIDGSIRQGLAAGCTQASYDTPKHRG